MAALVLQGDGVRTSFECYAAEDAAVGVSHLDDGRGVGRGPCGAQTDVGRYDLRGHEGVGRVGQYDAPVAVCHGACRGYLGGAQAVDTRHVAHHPAFGLREALALEDEVAVLAVPGLVFHPFAVERAVG